MMDWTVINQFRGKPGAPGGASTVAVGATNTGAPGSNATVTNSGTPTAAVLDFSIPRGNPGNPGSAATVAVGTVTTGAAGSSATVTNAGTANAAVLNFSIPQGNVGIAGPAAISSPTNLTPAFGTAYATAVPTKPSFISAVIDAAYTVTVIGTQSDTVELRVGPVQATVANGTGGFRVASFRASVTGIALVVGMGLGQGNQISGWVPVGWFWAIRRVAGTTATITNAIEQTLG